MGVDFETSERYDLVVSNQTFGQLVNPKEDLRKVAEILTDDGLASVEVPNWLNVKQVYKGRNLFKGTMHYNYFSPHTLADMARRVGLKVVKKAPVVERTAAIWMYKTVTNALGVGTCSVLLSK